MKDIPIVRIGKKIFPLYKKAVDINLESSPKVMVQASGKNCQMACYLAAVFQDSGHPIEDIKFGLNKVKDTAYTTIEYMVCRNQEELDANPKSS